MRISSLNPLYYQASSLKDIALQIDKMAEDAANSQMKAKTQKEGARFTGKYSAYKHVAEMLRRTRIDPNMDDLSSRKDT